MLRIAYIIPHLNYGGAELVVCQQVNYLHTQGYDVHLIILDDIVHLPISLKLPNSNVVSLQLNAHTLTQLALKRLPFILPKLYRYIKRYCITHVVAHLPLAHFCARLLKLAHWQLKVIAYHHSLQYQASPLNTFAKQLFNHCHRLLARVSDTANIGVSVAVLTHLQRHFYLRKPTLLYNSVAYTPVNGVIANNYYRQHHLQHAQYRIVLPGRLHADKGQAFFIEVVHALVQQYAYAPQQLQVIFAGGGPIATALIEKIRAYNLENHIHISHQIDNKLLLSMLKTANITVIPSINEAFGIVAIEALSQACTIIASCVGGLPEIITHKKNGFLLPAQNKHVWVNQIHELLLLKDKPIFEAQKLYNSYAQKFTLTAQMSKLIQLLQ